MEPGEWDSFPQAALVLPHYALIRANSRYTFSVNLELTETETIASASRRARMEAETFLAQLESAVLPTPSIPDEITTNETSREIWQNTIHDSVEMIHQGELKKVVMARPVQVNGNRSIDVPALLESLGESCPSCFRFLFEFSPMTIFAGATPERLVSVSGAKFTTAAIAGSIHRSDFPAEDEALRQQLIESQKDQSEHSFVKDEICARLENLVASLQVDAAPRLRAKHPTPVDSHRRHTAPEPKRFGFGRCPASRTGCRRRAGRSGPAAHPSTGRIRARLVCGSRWMGGRRRKRRFCRSDPLRVIPRGHRDPVRRRRHRRGL